jgi:prepilin-type N-terminal cleavage/methylation domain-containing protein
VVRPGRAQGAFSLIEIIAVLGVIAIIAAAALPALVQRIDYAAQGTEATNLGTLAAGLTQGSSRQRYIPSQSQTDWGTFIATNIGWPVNAVLTNAVNNPRVFLIDPNLAIGTTTATTLPYQQTSSGAASLTNARIIIISSLSSPLPAGLGNGVPPSSSDFNTLWNNPDNTIPTGTSWNWNLWKNHGADIKIQRINLASSFNRLTLTVLDPVNAPYSIDNFPQASVTTNTPLNAYFLSGGVVNLYYYYQTPPYTTNLQASQVLLQNASWVFSGGLWRNAPVSVNSQSILQNFYTNRPNPYTTNYPISVYNDMTNYMGLYVQYAPLFASPTIRNQLQTQAATLGTDIGLIITWPH